MVGNSACTVKLLSALITAQPHDSLAQASKRTAESFRTPEPREFRDHPLRGFLGAEDLRLHPAQHELRALSQTLSESLRFSKTRAPFRVEALGPRV